MSELDGLRSELDEIDQKLIEYFEKRCSVAKKVGMYKTKNRLPVKDSSRENLVIEKRLSYLNEKAYEKDAEAFIRGLMSQSRKIQRNVVRENASAPGNGNLYIVGLPGCGKSTVGKMYAREEGMNFIDLDIYIEQKAGKQISEIFLEGEDVFRDYESECLKEVAADARNTVIATGGGIVERTENIELLRKMKVVYLYRPVNLILKGKKIQGRPLLANGTEKIYELEKKRRPKYEQIAGYKTGNLGRARKTVYIMQKMIIKDDEKTVF